MISNKALPLSNGDVSQQLDFWRTWPGPGYLLLFAGLSLLGFRLLYGPVTGLALFYDEAYYHFWSQYPDWGYFSKPPLIAWLIYFTTELFHSQAEWAVRLASPLLYFFSAVFIYLAARRWFDWQIARYAAAIFYTSPLVAFNSLFITTDAPLLFFWSAALWCFGLAHERQKLPYWLLLGALLGLGLLSKYTMAVWLVGLVIYVFFQLGDGQRLKPSQWGITVGVALVFLMPNLVWNWQHDFISFQHTAAISKLNGQLFHPGHWLEFVAGQFIAFGPVAFFVLLSLLKHPKPAHNSIRFLLCLTLPLLSGISLQALLAKANMNWAAPVYVAASILVARQLIETRRIKLAGILLWVNIILTSVFYAYPYLQSALHITPTTSNTPFHRVVGWKPLMQDLSHLVAHPEQQVWLSDSRMLLSYLHYYLLYPNDDNTQVKLVSFNADGRIEHQFDLSLDLKTSPYPNYLFVSEQVRDFSGCFRSFSLIGEVHRQVYPGLIRQLYLYRTEGFSAYEDCSI